MVLLHGVLDVRVDEQRVDFRVDVLDRDLEAVEAARLGHLHLRAEVHGQVLVHDAVAGREERQHMRDEVALVVREVAPVLHIVDQVQLLGRPEAGLGLLIHGPHLGLLDREEHESVRVLRQERLRQQLAVELLALVQRDGHAALGHVREVERLGRLVGAAGLAGAGREGSGVSRLHDHGWLRWDSWLDLWPVDFRMTKANARAPTLRMGQSGGNDRFGQIERLRVRARSNPPSQVSPRASVPINALGAQTKTS